MEAMSKYAGLPGIDTDSPDVFETSDEKVGKDDGKTSQDDFESEDIEKVTLNTQLAFNKFKGKYLDSNSADFSDHIGMPKRRGYETRGQYEILGDRSCTKETPGQKYQRLQHELKELSEDLEEIKNVNNSEEKENKMTYVGLANEVKDLQKQLQSWQLDTIIGSEFLTGPSFPQGTVQKKLQHQLETFKEASKTKTGDKGQSKDNCVTYELMYKPEHVKLNQVSKVCELEERVKKLEGLLGPDSPQLSTIFDQSVAEERCLAVVVASIQEKLAILDTTHVEHVEHIDARLQGLLHHLTQLSSRKSDMENVERNKEISELYDLVSKWDATADVVPELIRRLETLKSLHDQANQFGASLTHLDSTQTAITSQLQNQQNLFNEVTKNFEMNIASIGENISKLDARVDILMKSYEKSGR